MLNYNKYKNLAIILFSFIQLILFVTVQATSGIFNTISSFAVVVLCCLFVILYIEKSKDYIFTQIALICTVMADLFLVVLQPMKQLPAMIFFSITQICYFLRLFFNTKSKKEKQIHIIIRAASSFLAIILTIVVLKAKADALSLVSMFYYANLIINIVFAFIHFKSSNLLAIGLLLFLCCDTIVGINVLLDQYITSPSLQESINSILSSLNWAWIFYVPSQTLLALSLTKLNNKMSY